MGSISAGIILTNGTHILLCHPTEKSHYDLPKGGVDPGEMEISAAVRELQEETGLKINPGDLTSLGHFPYRNKTLSLWLYRVDQMPNPNSLKCESNFITRDGRTLPEMDGYKVVTFEQSYSMLRGAMVPVIQQIVKSIIPTPVTD